LKSQLANAERDCESLRNEVNRMGETINKLNEDLKLIQKGKVSLISIQ
jgi:hypothetical protein